MTLLKHVADIRVSNVDKKSAVGEFPVRLCNYTDVYYSDVLTSTSRPYLHVTASPQQIERFRMQAGDTLLTKDSETAGDIGVSAYVEDGAADLLCGYHLALVRPNPAAVDSRYLSWILRSNVSRSQLAVAATGVTRFGLRSDALARLEFDTLLRGEQRRIADFLDEQVGIVDQVITMRARQRLMIRERGDARVTERCTSPRRGADRPRTDFTWLREDGTSFVKLAWVADLQSGLTIDAQRAGAVEYPYLSVANVQSDRLELAVVKTVTLDPQVAVRFTLRSGDVLVTEGGDLDKLGRGTVWRGEIDPCLHQNHVFALRPHPERLLPGYLAALTRTHHARRYFEMTGSRSTNLASTNSSKVLDFRFPLPDISRQRRILDELHADELGDADLDAALERQVALLQERKQALITAAVTGQFDVTTARKVSTT